MNKILLLTTLFNISFVCRAAATSPAPTTLPAPAPVAAPKTLHECQLDVKNAAQVLASEINNLKQAVDKIGTQRRRHIGR